MASASLLNPSGNLPDCPKADGECCFGHYHNPQSDGGTCSLPSCAQFKKRRLSHNGDEKAPLPVLHSSDYYMEPSADELVTREASDCGYCSRVPNFVVGRVGYGQIKFLSDTDVRWMDLDQVIKFNRHSVLVYENEDEKPPVGQELNKTAEVTLILQLKSFGPQDSGLDKIVTSLRKSSERQGAQFLSFDWRTGEWKFLVHHFSRFGLDDEEEADIVVDDVVVLLTTASHEGSLMRPTELALSHSLPGHLGLDPVRMQEMRMLMFPGDEEGEELDDSFPSNKRLFGKEYMRADSTSTSGKSPMCISPLQGSSQKTNTKISHSSLRTTPVALLEYNVNNSESSPSRSILMTGQNKGLPVRAKKVEGFKLEEKHATPLTSGHSHNVVDAALFMGRSFRVGWGPNGTLVHSGTPVGKTGSGLSSFIHIEKVALDHTVRDEKKKKLMRN